MPQIELEKVRYKTKVMSCKKSSFIGTFLTGQADINVAKLRLK